MSDTYVCDECGVTFDHKPHLQEHQAAEHKERDVPCPVCGREFATENGMNCHRGKAHDQPWQDKDVLEKLHVDKGYNCPEIADKLGCSQSAVERYVREYGLQQYSRGHRKHKTPVQHRFINKDRRVGYEYETVRTQVNYETKGAGVHQLIAIAQGADPDKVFSNGDYQTHHKNGHGLDNRPGNIELVSAQRHRDIHSP